MQQKTRQGSIVTAENKIKILVVSLTACILVILLAVILVKTGVFDIVGGMFVPGGKAQTGTIPISDGLNDVKNVPKGEVRYRINKTVTFQNGYEQGDIMLENPASCEFSMVFSFYTEDSTLIYESPILKPGEYLFKDKLKKKLKKGVYKCAYKVTAYNSDDVIAGETGGYLTITVKN